MPIWSDLDLSARVRLIVAAWEFLLASAIAIAVWVALRKQQRSNNAVLRLFEEHRVLPAGRSIARDTYHTIAREVSGERPSMP